ncbi:hypothetical protein VVD49_01675 [Uliginosibacterium sp. H3]|uniref:Exopolysaccharide biosynthesis operon protein EpsL n=1 Tax=Uliginosibacterium silvisoli TaxID=3114758 RepID=A0ABU6JZL7_9RHOO|nr:hypothetical protein [Uliginosibacterium sp. H3]
MKIIARSPRLFWRMWLSLSPTVALLAYSGLATARDGNVFGLTLAETLQYDTNPMRVASETDNRRALNSDRRDDFISSTTAALTASKQLGRHNLYGELSQTYVVFQEFTRLNYTSENSRVGWSGVYGAENNWDAYYRHTVTHSDFADLQLALTNLVTSDTLGARLSQRIATDWLFRPEVSQNKDRNSADIKKGGDGTTRNVWLNLGYRPYTANVLEAQYRLSEREYVYGGGYRQNELGAFGSWGGNTASAFELRVALVEQRAKSGSASQGVGDFHQVVGHANYRWRPTGASTLNFRLFREISTINFGTDQDAVARGGTASWSWTPLAKVKFDTIFDYRKREFPNTTVIDPGSPGSRITVHDRTHYVSLGATYVPTQALTVQANARTETRHADPSYLGYEDRVYSLTLQYAF